MSTSSSETKTSLSTLERCRLDHNDYDHLQGLSNDAVLRRLQAARPEDLPSARRWHKSSTSQHYWQRIRQRGRNLRDGVVSLH